MFVCMLVIAASITPAIAFFSQGTVWISPVTFKNDFKPSIDTYIGDSDSDVELIGDFSFVGVNG